MKRFLVIVAMCLAAAMVHAQGSSGGILYASDFAAWSLPQGTGPASGTIAYPDPSICHVSSKGYNFVAPKVGRSLKILDSGVPANSETVVPTQVVVGPSGCTITATMAHTHLSYSVVSGTAGLQEAIDYQTGLPQGALVYLTPSWTLAGGVTSMITSAYGTTLVSILDERTAVIVPYTWNGSAYVAVPFAGGSTSWSSLTNATGALALTNTGHSSTFTQGSADGWTWQNTASTSAGTVEQDSPFLALAGMYYTGSADAADLWEIKDGIDTGTNGSSTLTFSHSGSSGAATVAVPALTVNSLPVTGPSETYNATASGAIVLPSADRSEATYVLSGDVTSSTIAAGVGGAQVTLIVCQPSGRSYTFALPANVSSPVGPSIVPTSATCTVNPFVYLTWASFWVSGVGTPNALPYPL